MQIVICTFIAAVLAGILSFLALCLSPAQGNGFISQGGATLFESVGVFVFLCPVLWFPCLIAGYFIMRRSLSKRQKRIHIIVTGISAIVFFKAASMIGNTVLQHR
jgi:hypothetical protein